MCFLPPPDDAPSWPLYHRPGLGWTVQIARYRMRKIITGLTSYLGHTVHFMGFSWRDPGTTTVGYPKGSPTTVAPECLVESQSRVKDSFLRARHLTPSRANLRLLLS